MADVKMRTDVSASTHPPSYEGDSEVIDPHSGVKRGLKTRHLSMMALAGIIGPGLLIGSGGEMMFTHSLDPNRQLVISLES